MEPTRHWIALLIKTICKMEYYAIWQQEHYGNILPCYSPQEEENGEVDREINDNKTGQQEEINLIESQY
jgi:hypothetical protein